MLAKPTRVLVVCAHPGDDILGCGGTLAHHVRQQHQVRVLVLGDGWTSRVRSMHKANQLVDLEVIESHGRAALKTLGIDEVEYMRLPDNRFDELPLLSVVKTVEAVKRSYRPHLLYTNSLADLSVDQQITCQAVLTAFRPLPGESFMEVLSFETPSSTEWQIGSPGAAFEPDYFVDISTTLKDKLTAFEHFSFEVRNWPHPRSLAAIGHRAKSRGSSIGVDAAEAFRVMRAVKCSPARSA